MITKGIIDDEIVQKEAAAEIARRLVRYKFEVAAGKENEEVLNRVRTILKVSKERGAGHIELSVLNR